MFQQEVAQKKKQIEQLEKLIEQERNQFLITNYKTALELRKNELKELEKMQKEYDLGVFDVYQYKYQEALKDFIRYANLHRWDAKTKK